MSWGFNSEHSIIFEPDQSALLLFLNFPVMIADQIDCGSKYVSEKPSFYTKSSCVVESVTACSI